MITWNKIRKFFLTLYIMMTPVWYNVYAGATSRDYQESWYRYLALFLIATFLSNAYIAMFLMWNVVLFIQRGGIVGSEQLLNIFIGCLLFYFARIYFKTNKFQDLYKPILIVLVINLVFMLFQVFKVDPLQVGIDSKGEIYNGPLQQVFGLFGLPMANGIFLTLCLPILMSLSSSSFLVSFILLVPIYLCKSSAVAFATATIYLFYTWHLHRKAFRILLPLFIFAGSIFIAMDIGTDPLTFKSRWPMWHATLKHALANPLGYGPDSFRNMNNSKDFDFQSDGYYNLFVGKVSGDTKIINYHSVHNDREEVKAKNEAHIKGENKQDRQIARWDNPHNDYLQLLFQYGFIGVILLILIIKDMRERFVDALKDKELITITCCLLVYVTTSLTQFPFGIARTAFFFPILLGAFFAKTERKKVEAY